MEMVAMHCGKTRLEKLFSRKKAVGQRRAALQNQTTKKTVLDITTSRMICTSVAVLVICVIQTLAM